MNKIVMLFKALPFRFKLIIVLIIFGIVAGSYGWAFIKGVQWQKNRQENRVIEKIVEIQEKKDEIRSNRPDDAALTKRLLDGTY